MKNVIQKAIKLAKEDSLKAKPKKIVEDDEALVKTLEESKAKIAVVGVGGSGCNTMQRMSEVGIVGATSF
ncbi:MAG: cell division protein FtsZ, partial [Candidatus Diapherotrites archaeon]